MLLRIVLAGICGLALTAHEAQAGPFGIFGQTGQSGCQAQTAAPDYRFPRLHPFKAKRADQAAPVAECRTSPLPVFTGPVASQARTAIARIPQVFGGCPNGRCEVR